MITWDNYEEYMMMHADGELKPAEEQELMNFVFEHPELQNELAAFSMTKMIPDTTQTYAHKTTLIKPVPTSKIIPFGKWKRSAIAAGVAALVSLSIYKLTVQPNNTTDVAGLNNPKNTTTNSNTNNNTLPTDNEPPATTLPVNTPNSAAVASYDVATKPSASKVANATIQKQLTKQVEEEKNTDMGGMATYTITKNAIDKIEPTLSSLPKEEKKYFSVAVTNVPDVAIYIDNGQTTQSFLDKLPIDELKKEGMVNVASALASGYDKVNAIRHSLSETSISLKLQNKKLTVSF